MKATSTLRRFQLWRTQDESGVSGTGLVAEGIEFTSGKVALTWISQHGAVNVYDNIKVVESLHGHEGKTKIMFIDGPGSRPKKTKDDANA